MGIDIYARWPGRTAAEIDAQSIGFSIEHGHVGYLREAYHGEPYATEVLVPEAFDLKANPDGAHIPAATLRERLPKALATAAARQLLIYNKWPEHETTRVLQSFSDFVELCERKERETGQPCTIVASY
jgi:hypothetical protein